MPSRSSCRGARGHLVAVPAFGLQRPSCSLPLACGALFDALFMFTLNEACHVDARQMDLVWIK